MIKVQNLTKKFGELRAVDNVSFAVEQGDILGFLGRNGAGKTTSMRMITGFISPTSGSVLIDGDNVFDAPQLVKRKIGYLPETPPLYLDMTTQVYLEHVAHLKGLRHRDIKREIERASDRCGLESVRGRLLKQLSKGFRQRVGLAQALLGNPKILVLDEPSSGLDPAQIREIRKLIKELAQEHTVILSTHILGEVQRICNRVIIIHNGQIVANNTIDKLSGNDEDSRHCRVSTVANEKAHKILKDQAGIEKISIVEPNEVFDLVLADGSADYRSALLQQLIEAGCPVTEFQNMAPTLEDIFLRTIRGDIELEDEDELEEEDENEESEEEDESDDQENEDPEEEDDSDDHEDEDTKDDEDEESEKEDDKDDVTSEKASKESEEKKEEKEPEQASKADTSSQQQSNKKKKKRKKRKK